MLLEKIDYLARGADMVVFAGTLPRGVEDSFYAEAIRELNRRSVRAVLDSEGQPLRLGAEAEAFLVTPNQREAEALVGQEFGDDEDYTMALDRIAELGARNVLITAETRKLRALPRGTEAGALPRGRAAGRAGLRRRVGRRPACRVPRGTPRREAARGLSAGRGRRRRGFHARGRRRPLRPEGGVAAPGLRGRPRAGARGGLTSRLGASVIRWESS